MATTIPVPIEFSLPAGWRSVPPDELDAPEAAFLALHPGSSKGFTANIAISGEVRGEDVTLTEVADEAIEKLKRGVRNIDVGTRSESGTQENPGLTQVVRMEAKINDQLKELLQLTVYLGMRDVGQPNRRAVLHIVLTSLPEQFPVVAEDFQKFIATIKPEQRPSNGFGPTGARS